MATSSLAQRERLIRILDAVTRHGSVSIDDLSEQLQVSRMTIHRDLDELEREGHLRKVRGGATAERSATYESDFSYRQRQAVAEKQQMAAAALAQVEPGMVVMLDSSTTVQELGRLLPAIEPLTVVTNLLPTMQELANVPGLRLIGLGGDYHQHYAAFLGMACERSIRELRADIAFISVSAIDGLTVCHQEEQVVRLVRAMTSAASKSVLIADHTKFGGRALNVYGRIDEFDLVIVDEAISPSTLDLMRESGVTVEVASAASEDVEAS